MTTRIFLFTITLLISLPSFGQEMKKKDYSADVASVDAIIAALYDVISGPAEMQRDWKRMRYLFATEARLRAVRAGKDGQASLLAMTIDDYVKRVEKPFMENGFFESELYRATEQYGHVTHAFSTYESRHTADGPVVARGINSIQIANYEGRFWIVSILWNGETEERPIPEKYLPEPALLNQEVINHEGEKILVGKANREGLQQEPYGEWFEAGYQSYGVDTEALAGLDKALERVDIMLFMGTWCSDSQRDVPHFYKILDHLDYDMDKLTVVALSNHPDNYKESPQHEEEGMRIDYVPTIIFFRNGEEIGRIVEYPQESLEKDMREILNN